MLDKDQVARLEAELDILNGQYSTLSMDIQQHEVRILHGSPETGRWLSSLGDLYLQREGVAHQIGRVEALLDYEQAVRDILEARGPDTPASPDDWYKQPAAGEADNKREERDPEDRDPSHHSRDR